MRRTEEGVAMRDTQYVRRSGRKMSPGVDLAAQLKGQLEAMNRVAAEALALPSVPLKPWASDMREADAAMRASLPATCTCHPAAPVRPVHAFWGALAACGCPVAPISGKEPIARAAMLMGCYAAILRESGVDVDALMGGAR